jgi:AraC-like DNA-binding protein
MSKPEIRGNWEFMAILEGRAKPVCIGGPDYKFLSKRLWIMPPMSEHSWFARENEQCEVIVMHFASLPVVMRSLISYEKPTRVAISQADIAAIRAIYAEVLPHYEHPGLDCIVWFQKALVDLCIIAVSKNKQTIAPTPDADRSAIIIKSAFDWYRSNLSKSPGIEDISEALNVPVSQLRRIFLARLNQTPMQALRTFALDEACKMMVNSSLCLKEISSKCGFAKYAHFHRAFRGQFRVPPVEWRENRFYGVKGFKTHRL